MGFIEYDIFLEKLCEKIPQGQELYQELLNKVIDNPNRYTGLFRLTNAKTKLIQNITQSQEIRLGDFLEEIVTEYLEIAGYTNKCKRLEKNEYFKEELNVDQLFEKDNVIYMVEQKMRDDHDSTKKRGQYENFIKKMQEITFHNPDKKNIGIMWFIDGALQKNKNYYQSEMNKNKMQDNYELYLFYEEELFNYLGMDEYWDELTKNLLRHKREKKDEVLSIPDFDTSEEILNCMLKLSDKRWKALNSNDEKYVYLRRELFPTMKNINEARKLREK